MEKKHPSPLEIIPEIIPVAALFLAALQGCAGNNQQPERPVIKGPISAVLSNRRSLDVPLTIVGSSGKLQAASSIANDEGIPLPLDIARTKIIKRGNDYLVQINLDNADEMVYLVSVEAKSCNKSACSDEATIQFPFAYDKTAPSVVITDLSHRDGQYNYALLVRDNFAGTCKVEIDGNRYSVEVGKIKYISTGAKRFGKHSSTVKLEDEAGNSTTTFHTTDYKSPSLPCTATYTDGLLDVSCISNAVDGTITHIDFFQRTLPLMSELTASIIGDQGTLAVTKKGKGVLVFHVTTGDGIEYTQKIKVDEIPGYPNIYNIELTVAFIASLLSAQSLIKRKRNSILRHQIRDHLNEQGFLTEEELKVYVNTVPQRDKDTQALLSMAKNYNRLLHKLSLYGPDNQPLAPDEVIRVVRRFKDVLSCSRLPAEFKTKVRELLKVKVTEFDSILANDSRGSFYSDEYKKLLEGLNL